MDQLRKKIYSFKLTIPWLIIFILFFIGPTVVGFYFAFTNWNLSEAEFVGLANFKEILSNQSMSGAFSNTFLFMIITVVFKISIAMFLAILVNQKLKTQNFLRGAFFFPVLMTFVATGVIFKAILHPEVGLLNSMLAAVGLEGLAKGWLVETDIVMLSIAGIDIWKGIGFHMVIFLAGLQSISSEYYEAANIDGASSWQKFKNITFPLLTPIFHANILLAVIQGMKVFDLVLVTTGGGPGYASVVINTFIFNAFSMGRYGLAVAGELLLFLIIIIFTIVLRFFLERREKRYGL
ncbi:carbohydrate ABC transporter permease [Metabacillus halosaccharovorans]|uniref:carbohydrate ABC transporter permease n=1 Tax=Metabacillus halosaccharovorans TaxID=930124 RepID=UPI001C1FB051|nr:sugar ABC transporter permease [Metabacillus halosaccharovorans]MBU7591281.1 sugar ABC transporter permease [Metabacillus halosaccharovorans]